MKNFLAIDTSSKHLTVIAKKGSEKSIIFLPDCALSHSTELMDAIEKALSECDLKVSECDFFCAVTGPGSFTGIRIGVSTVKGFAVGTGMSAFGVTSFETLAYNTDKACLAVIDAGRGNYYACGFDKNKQIDIEPCFVNESKILELCKNREIISCDNLPFSHIKADAAVGYNRAIEDKLKKNNMEKVSAFYLKKSQAEEEKK